MTREPGASATQLDLEIDRIQKMINSPQMRDLRRAGEIGSKGIKPRNAATLILIDRRGRTPRLLMGRRHRSLKFMPGALVFPGGSVDRSDGGIVAAEELPDPTNAKIVGNMRGRPSSRAARALGMAAIREMAEETGLLIGIPGAPSIRHDDWIDFDRHSVIPSLAGFSLMSRAITPPGPPRRFDTWFFVLDAAAVAHAPASGFEPSGELEALQWVTPAEAIEANTREITRVMLVELMNRLQVDPKLDPKYPAPFYRSFRNRFLKSVM